MQPKTHQATTKHKKMTRYNSSPFPACFRPPSTTTPALEYHHTAPQTTTTTTTPNLTTCLYQTHLGLFSLTWSRSLLTRTLHLNLHPSSSSTPSSPISSPSFHLTLKPFMFWTKQGSKHLPFQSTDNSNNMVVYWDFTRAKFGSSPEPESGYYIAVVVNAETVLFIGDMEKEFDSKSKKATRENQRRCSQSLVVRREHVCGDQFYTTRIKLGGKDRVIFIELNKSKADDPRLVIKFDAKRVLQVKHLRWKFRGSERVEVDGHKIQLSWDVYNWLFEEGDVNQDDGYALFTFRFENDSMGECGVLNNNNNDANNSNHLRYYNISSFDRDIDKKERVLTWSQDSCGLSYERKKMKKKMVVKTRSASSSSLSSASSRSSSSVMEWESVEENELKGPTGFSLLVYAWKN